MGIQPREIHVERHASPASGSFMVSRASRRRVKPKVALRSAKGPVHSTIPAHRRPRPKTIVAFRSAKVRPPILLIGGHHI